MRIKTIDLYPYTYRTKGFFKFFVSPRGKTGRASVFVRITADDGTVGWGQSVPIETWSYETLETTLCVIRDYYAPLLIGADPCDFEQTSSIMNSAISPSFSTGMPLSRAGIDIALHDLAGKIRGESLGELWGRAGSESLTLSWTVNAQNLDEADAQIEAGSEQGYRNFNIKVAPDIAFDVALARRVRQKFPDSFLWADANGGYDSESAPRAVRLLADAGVDVLEAPLRPNQIRGYQKLRKLRALPLFMDEGVVSPIELEEFICLGMMDGLAMKPGRCGGLLSARRQIELIERYELGWLGSGLADPDVSLAASLALYGAYGLQKPAALNGPQFLVDSLLLTPLEIKGDLAQVPQGPGIGIEVDEEKLIRLSEGQNGSS